MTSKPAANEPRFSRGVLDNHPKPFFKRLKHQLGLYFQMPPVDPPTLPEALLKFIPISSWPVASITVGVLFYLSFVGLAYLDGFAAEFDLWWNALIFPVVTVYLLLIQPIMRRLMTLAIETYRLLVPYNDRFKRLEAEAYSLNRRREWIVFSTGAIIGWVFMENPLPPNHISSILYDYVGEALAFGLTAWHIYAAIVRTRLLSIMHDQVQSLNVFEQSVPYWPIIRWSLGVVICLFGCLVVSYFFIPPALVLSPSVISIYAVFTISVILIFVFTKVPASMLTQLRVVRAFILFLIVAIVGTVGYNRLENWSLVESLYATIITMTTIGYGDFSPSSSEGRVFTIVLSLFAIGIGGYAVTSVASFVIEGNFHRFIQGKRVDNQIVRLKDHYVLCGSGRMGKQIALELYKTEVPFVVIEQSPTVLEELLREMDIPYVQGDATQDEVLLLAGVERARGLVAALSEDKNNVFIALSARHINPDLHIISRVSQVKNRRKMLKAGANVVISPEEVSGRRMIAEMLNSEVVTLLDEMLRAERQTGQTLRLEELYVSEIKAPSLVEKLENDELHIYDIGQRSELMVVAIERGQRAAGEDRYIYSPRGVTKLHRGDVLIVISTPDQRLKLNHEVLSQSFLELWTAKLLG
ncbi:MAG: NAD-binding protein [Anaerolineae bacterium]|nr:NAD-binding protein [Anaerolineae bacterium]MCB0180941.1 NAD-binding protein [Anaerolineae bacterium]MCB0223507.1 NAD-binding protein [Anaerolineae bacterium]MCB9105842.1 NAD-binding protein [Anaerolineales bacterium]